MSAGRIAAAAVVGVGTVLVVRRLVEGRPKTASVEPKLEDWEREALARGHVGAPEGEHPQVIDHLPVGRGVPAEHCVLLGAGEAQVPEAPHCVFDPLTDPRFAPVDRGAPPTTLPSSSTWPVLTQHPGRLLVSYWTAEGPRGYSGRAFAARRTDSEGDLVHHRNHAGVDLFAHQGDVVVAPEDATVLRILPFHAGTWAVYLRSMLGDRILNLGEVARLSWREFGARPGQTVLEGQPLARVGVQAGGSTMLHVETYAVPEDLDDAVVVAAIRARELSWPADAPPPAWLRDPSAYLVTAAARTYQREAVLA